MVEIIDYQDHYLEDFRKLNRDWLEKYNALDDYDLVILNDPQKIILEPGGFIFFAQDRISGELVGTVSLMKISTRSFEVTKMCVAENHKKKGIGLQLEIKFVATVDRIDDGQISLRSFLIASNLSSKPTNLYLHSIALHS